MQEESPGNISIDSIISYCYCILEKINSYQSQYPQDWDTFVLNYGEGGGGCGRYYSANVYIGQILKNRERKGVISFVEFVLAPTEWGNDVIAFWEY